MTMWKYLRGNDPKVLKFDEGWDRYIGRFAEDLARKKIGEWFEENQDDIFEGEIVYVDKLYPNSNGHMIQSEKDYERVPRLVSDFALICTVKTPSGKYEKHSLVFEVKYNKSPIEGHHVRYWTDLVKNPSKYIDGTKTIRLYMMWVDEINVEDKSILATFREVKPSEFPPPDKA